MRDPARIERIMSKLRQLWERAPDQRFNQMVVNLGFAGENLYDLEDEIFELRLDQALLPGGRWS